jgi:hypothetical protein
MKRKSTGVDYTRVMSYERARNSLGVYPVCCLKMELNADLELNPARKHIEITDASLSDESSSAA